MVIRSLYHPMQREETLMSGKTVSWLLESRCGRVCVCSVECLLLTATLSSLPDSQDVVILRRLPASPPHPDRQFNLPFKCMERAI